MQQSELTKEKIEKLGYQFPRRLPNGEWIALYRFLFTWGIILGLDEIGYKRRFCYKNINDALNAVANWNGENDPPGDWIVEKPGDRQGPGTITELNITNGE